MDLNLLDITVRELLEKFGEGEHKPGSGSGAAFQGMISAQLLITVITLTNDEKRREIYKSVLPELLKIKIDIEKIIFPKLSDLFIQDSIQFDKTIKARKARDEENDIIEKSKLNNEALEELKISINIPWHIAKLCITLCENAAIVFDNGFKSARGDSQVALSGAVSALGGCISIIRLNLLSYKSNEYKYISKVISEVTVLERDYNRLNKIANSKIGILKKEVESKIPLYKIASELSNKYKTKTFLKDKEIEECAIALQDILLNYKDIIWPVHKPKDIIETLNTEKVFKKVLGYDFHTLAPFGILQESGDTLELAGLINQKDKFVLISNKFELQTQNFTAAHELGHAFLHPQLEMHRDVPIDNLGQYKTRDKNEKEADKFASYFLMPAIAVKDAFYQIFSTDRLILDNDIAFNLIQGSISDLRKRYKTKRQFSRYLASTQIYNFQSFQSISNIFGVSVESMAIRLEELNLIDY